MIKRVFIAANWHILRLLKQIYYFIRIAIYPYKKINNVTIPLKAGWGFTVKDHIIRGDYETGELTIISKTISVNDRILEIGSGLGFLAIYCSKQVGEKNVISFEANPYLEPYHNKIFKINNIFPVIIYKAVSLNNNPISLNIDTKKFWSTSILPFKSKDIKKVTVDSVNINDIIKLYAPTYLIVDIEGFEIELLPEITDFLTIQKLQLEIHPNVTGNEQIINLKNHLIHKGFSYNSDISTPTQLYFFRG